MSFMNKLGDIVRDLPILDFMDPYYKVRQTVVKDVLYDVNFTAMPAVDRCTSCHLGINDPDFVDAEQPYTTHPDLDLYLTVNHHTLKKRLAVHLATQGEVGVHHFYHLHIRQIVLNRKKNGKKNTIGSL